VVHKDMDLQMGLAHPEAPTFTATISGSGMIPAVMIRIITSIIHGSTDGSPVALAVATSSGFRAEVGTVSGSTGFYFGVGPVRLRLHQRLVLG